MVEQEVRHLWFIDPFERYFSCVMKCRFLVMCCSSSLFLLSSLSLFLYSFLPLSLARLRKYWNYPAIVPPMSMHCRTILQHDRANDIAVTSRWFDLKRSPLRWVISEFFSYNLLQSVLVIRILLNRYTIKFNINYDPMTRIVHQGLPN